LVPPPDVSLLERVDVRLVVQQRGDDFGEEVSIEWHFTLVWTLLDDPKQVVGGPDVTWNSS
jgi:hypothetical protein